MSLPVSTRNARFQQWEALLRNRAKRQRAGEFLVQGVRPIGLAVRRGWPVRALLHDAARRPSRWAADLLDRVDAPRYALAPDLLAELGDKDEGLPELVAVVALPPDDLARVPAAPDLLAVVFDRPTSPGNIGTLVRSADAFGAAGLVVTGHAADPYDPRAVRASTGSLFAVPVVRASGHGDVLDWVAGLRAGGVPAQIVGTDEAGERELSAVDLTRPTLLLVGNETSGLSAAWRGACDALARIPIGGAASSLNAATAGGIALYEAARQRAGRAG
ncbi:TrmH family RNA methyltransferase [Rhizomonospora bruguierae]|uniref:TrmH family RNA methyltransferase n=1 Tax=Rhizomonospora bruguierae TaxID=1581705 RepID=UPI001BD18116|nr:TrmH family RNA methyltransferase [Micromonospora sp. NBRC 107566]